MAESISACEAQMLKTKTNKKGKLSSVLPSSFSNIGGLFASGR